MIKNIWEGPQNYGPSQYLIHQWIMPFDPDIASYIKELHSSDQDPFNAVSITPNRILVQIPGEIVMTFPGAIKFKAKLQQVFGDPSKIQYSSFSVASAPIILRVAHCTGTHKSLELLSSVISELVFLLVTPGDDGIDIKLAYFLENAHYERIIGLKIIDCQDSIFDASDPSSITSGVGAMLESAGAEGATKAISLGLQAQQEKVRRIHIRKEEST